MSYTAKQWRAINWIVKRDKLVPQISAWPRVRFKRPDGTILEEFITDIVAWYDNHLEQQKRVKREASKASKRKEGA